jgi:peptidoglycan/LPS O-acetylase OafA/YrhL
VSPAADRGYFPAVDGLRGIAVLLVLFNHSTLLFPFAQLQDHPLWRRSLAGWIGVDLFFVISGFLITRLLLRAHGERDALRVFWFRRALRIFPLAYAYLAVVVALAAAHVFPELNGPHAFGWAALYLTNFYIAKHIWAIAAINVLWSLAVEEQFYMLWPLVALRCSRRVVVNVLWVVILGTPLVRAVTHLTLGPRPTCLLTFCRWDSLAFGAGLAAIWVSPWRAQAMRYARRLLLPSLIAPGLVLATPVGSGDTPHSLLFDMLGPSALGLSFTVWMACALSPAPVLGGLLGFAPLRYLGTRCYGLYIWHILCGHSVALLDRKLQLGLGFASSMLLWLGLVLTVATLSFHFFESPLLALKKRLPRRGSMALDRESSVAFAAIEAGKL